MQANHTNLALKTPFMLLEFIYMMIIGCNHDTETKLENLLIINTHVFSSVLAWNLKCLSLAQTFSAWEISAWTHH